MQPASITLEENPSLQEIPCPAKGTILRSAEAAMEPCFSTGHCQPRSTHRCQGTAQVEAQIMRADSQAHCPCWDISTQALAAPSPGAHFCLTTEVSTQISATHLLEWRRFGMLQLSPCLGPAGQDMFSGHPRTLLSFQLQHHQPHLPAHTRACSMSHLSLAHSKSLL